MSTRSYWGAAGEQIDLQSGNLNFTIPIEQAYLTAGSSIPFALSYNSQNWRQDSGGVSNLGQDVGYGYGWKLQAGSILPVYTGNPAQLSYYVYSDATGAQYRLDQNNGGIWTSIQGTYVSFNASNNTLYFTNGTFWQMGDTSGPNEADAGTLYPTLVEDRNGNQVVIRYQPGSGNNGGSARIYEIQDSRAICCEPDNTQFTFLFQYDSTPHLTQITAAYPTGSGNYTLAYQSEPLFAPLGSSESFGMATLLQTVTSFNGQTFQYSAAGEMTAMTTPLGGTLSWSYRTFTYSSGVSYREVTTRYMTPSSGASTYQWNIGLDNNTTSHAQTTVQDLGAGTLKVWSFQTASGPFLGLATAYQEQYTGGATLLQKSYTWSQNGASYNPYVSSVTSILNPGQSYQAQTSTTQTLDNYGNLTNSVVTDYSGATRTYAATYVTNSTYTSLYLRNLLSTATVTPSGGGTTTLASIAYDSTACGVGLQDPGGLVLHDSNYNTNFNYRGNPTSVTQMGDFHCYGYQINGAVYYAMDGSNRSVGISLTSSTNYSLPGVLTPGSNSNLATNIYYEGSYAVSSLVNPNGATTNTTYDAWGRPSSTTIADGAVTNYAYSYNPGTQTASVTDPSSDSPGTARWTKTIEDGFGRTTSVIKGYGSISVSEVDTKYAPCGCSPLGKVSQVSEPYTPGGTPVWTTYTHDARGRMLTSTAPDGSVTQYSYQGNSTTVTDPAGNWKTNTSDAFGNLITVTEPRPGGGTNYVTSYTYNAANQLTNVQLIRDGNTQQRTLTWSGADLATATNPESGTTSYTYDGAHHVLTRTDARNQVTQYAYDVYGRLTSTAHYPNGLNNPADPNQQVTYYYDTYNQNTSTWGRLAAVAFGNTCPGGAAPGVGYVYTYSYNVAGRVTNQGMQVNLNQSNPNNYACSPYTVTQAATYGWDNEGRMTSLTYPGQTNNVTYAYDSMGNQNGLKDSVTNATASASYGTAGEMDGLTYDNPGYSYFNESFTYNNLWQLTGIGANETGTVMSMQYIYPAGHNNGRISQSIDGVLNQTVNYTYDTLNRLSTAQATSGVWGQSYSYDGFGNLTAKTVTAGSAMQFSAGYSPATNQQIGGSYDANGNSLTGPLDPTTGQHLSYTYDVENRIVSAGDSGMGYSYGYDPQNKRVMVQTSIAGSYPNLVFNSIFTFYSITGQRLSTFSITSADYNNSGFCNGETYCTSGPTAGYLYLAGKRLMIADRLGSQRGNGQAYYPWGEPMNSQASTGDVEFATYWRDMVGQDYADQRYYNSNAGRFYTPDRAGRKAVNPKNPTSWNMYAYTSDDPVNGIDPTGMDVVTSDSLSFTIACNTSLNMNVDDPYNSLCGGGNGAGWSSESAIGAAVEDSITDFSNLLSGNYADSGVLANFSTTVYGASDPSPVASPVSTTLTDTSDASSDPSASTLGPNGPSSSGIPTGSGTTSNPVSVGYTVSGIFVPPSLPGIGAAVTYTRMPSLNLTCVGLGFGASLGHNLSFGPTVVSTTSAQNILSGWSFSAGYNSTPLAGAGGSGNSSGVAGGNTFGIPGASASVTWSACW